MKKALLILSIVSSFFFLAACSKETVTESNIIEYETRQKSSLESFAEILSTAAYNEPELRSFIKEEALKEFDRDYDVFYPYVKNSIVKENLSFHDILQKYDNRNVLGHIEDEEPLLNILVPDWRWVDEGCFSVHNWDTTSPEVVVTYECLGSDIPLYADGELVDTLKGNEFISAPVLIVKRNERMVHNPTKSGPITYDFANPVYDGSLKSETKGTWYNHDYIFNVSAPDYAIAGSDLPSKVVEAFAESKKNAKMPQRDYIYYDMSAVKDIGHVDCRFEEQLYRFHFTNTSLGAFSDDKESGDNMVINKQIEYNYGEAISEDALKDYAWIEGSFELVFNIKAGDIIIQKVLPPISFMEAFAVKTIHFQWYQNVFRTVTYRKYWIDIKEIVPQWVYLRENLFTWDLYSCPLSYTVSIEEVDSDIKTTKTDTETYTFATNFNASGEASGSYAKIGFGAGNTAQLSRSCSVTRETTEKNDPLGNAVVQYINPVVLSSSNDKYLLNSYSTSSVVFQVIPIQLY